MYHNAIKIFEAVSEQLIETGANKPMAHKSTMDTANETAAFTQINAQIAVIAVTIQNFLLRNLIERKICLLYFL